MTIFAHETRRLARSPYFWALIAVLAVFLAYGTSSGVAWTRVRASTIATAKAENERATAQAKSTYERGRAGALVTLPLLASASFSIGQSDIYPSTDTVSILTKARQRSDRYELESPLALASGRFDLAFVIVFVLPLFVIALTSDLLGEERDAGTLAMLLAHPVSLAGVLAAKLTTRGVAVAAVTVIVPLVTMEIEAVYPGIPHLLAYTILVGATVTFWCLLAALVNVWVHSGATTATTLIFAWVACTVLVPSIASVAVTRLAPLPSRFDLLDALRGDDVRNIDGERLLAKYYGDHPDLIRSHESKTSFAERFTLVQRETMRRTAPIEAEHARRRRVRYEVAGLLRFASPSTIVREALDVLAGTDTGRFLEFSDRTEALRTAFADWMLPSITSGTQAHDVPWSQAPTLAPATERHLAAALSPALLGLCAFCLGCVAGIVPRLTRVRHNASEVLYAS